MNPIIAMLKEHNVSDEKVRELFQAFMENPMMAMGLVQQLGIPPEKLQQLMALVMMKLSRPKRSSKISSHKIK